jgi:DNA helicase-2/ATP-dependent DNA helicase PcrA
VVPGAPRSGSWLTNPAELPVVLRGDAPDLPDPALPADGDRKEVTDGLKAHKEALEERRLSEERRLLYVAITRAERELLLSGHWWAATGDTPRGPSDFLTELREIAEAHPELVVERWAEEPEEGSPNPVTAQPHTERWPVDPLGSRHTAVHEGAELVRAALAALPQQAPQLSLFDTGDGAEPESDPDDVDDPEGWAADVTVLLAERARAQAARPEVALPAALSVSQLVELAADPEALAARLRRPMPYPPNPHARRGTAFHAWLEQRFGATRLLDLDELPGAADDGAAADSELDTLRTAFLASAWADRRPVEVEVPFETVLFADDPDDPADENDTAADAAAADAAADGDETADPENAEDSRARSRAGTSLRGRMDAVFADPDGGWTVVDWKTGPAPDEARLPALSVQLAAYRLAWAALAGCPVERVRAAFHYVRADVTLSPADLLDAAGLRELLRGVPMAGAGLLSAP